MGDEFDFIRDDVTDLSTSNDKLSSTVSAQLMRIGNYSFECKEPLTFTSKGVKIVAPISNSTEMADLHIQKQEVVKIMGHFSRTAETVLCLYPLRKCFNFISETLKMGDDTENWPIQHRKILIKFETMTEEAQNVIKSIWDFFDEINSKEANEVVNRFCFNIDKPGSSSGNTDDGEQYANPNEIRQLLIYPPGKGGISINTEDYMCLATDQYLNDIIIDFYLKWVHQNIIPQSQRDKTFIFSTFFYKRLTTLSRHSHDKDVKQTAAQKRHARVQSWTKNVNLFEKDFIIIPINEQSHWFLAIICFPTLKGPVTFDTNQPVEPQQLKKQKGKKVSLQIGNTTITPLSKRGEAATATPTTPAALAEVCGVDEDSERDEAEGDESDLASDESDAENASNPTNSNNPAAANDVSSTSGSSNSNSNSNLNSTSNSQSSTTPTNSKSSPQAIKQPLIIIFDSLAGASRSRVVATLRDYLTCEFKVKQSTVPPHIYNKDNMPGHCVKVPQQNNFTDCGLFLLQYVEQFFNDPIRDYKVPIKQLSNWFDTITVTRKREEISDLLKKLLSEKNGGNQKIVLPDIPFPTLKGVLVEPPDDYNIEFEEDNNDDDATGSGDEEEDSAEMETEEQQPTPIKKATKVVASSSSLVVAPAQGRQIVLKRRIKPPASDGSPAPTSSRSSLKIRKLDQ